MNRSLTLIILAGFILSNLISCNLLNYLSLKKIPSASQISGYYVGTIPGFESGFNQVLIHIDTFGSTQIYALKGLKGLQIHRYSAKLKAQKDSSYNLVMEHKTQIYLKRTKEEQLQLRVKNTRDSLFESGKHNLKLINQTELNNQQIEALLLKESGIYLASKTPNKNVYLSIDQNIIFQDPNTLKETRYRLPIKDLNRLEDGSMQATIETNEGNLYIQFLPNKGETTYSMSVYDSWDGAAWESNGNPIIEGHATLINPGFLLNGNWELTHLKTYAIEYIRFPQIIPNLSIQRFGKSFIGNNGCNQIFGSFIVEGNQLKHKDPVGSTKKFCEDTDDALFLEMLVSVQSYSVSGTVLTLHTKEGPMTFKLKTSAP